MPLKTLPSLVVGNNHQLSLASGLLQDQWRIQDFREGGANPRGEGESTYYLAIFFAENCMKELHEMKELRYALKSKHFTSVIQARPVLPPILK